MPNVDSPQGFKPARYVSGAPYNGATNPYSTASGDSTALFIGDPVKLAGTSQTIDGVVYADVTRAATTDTVIGVVASVRAATADSLKYRAGSTVRIINVVDDPAVLFEIQEVSGGTALTANDIGLNAPFVVGSGSTTTGYSGVELNNSGEATTASVDCEIVGAVNRGDNAIGEHCKWLVRLNNHRRANATAGV